VATPVLSFVTPALSFVTPALSFVTPVLCFVIPALSRDPEHAVGIRKGIGSHWIPGLRPG
ncbi:MAG: hypothetical protein NWS28_04625, partial [Limnohabitans sp.]|nr:hypothetical protein [Limnohabitans sp.]